MLGRAIREERDRRGWSQSELARQSGVTQGHINQIESGKRQQPNRDTVERLAAAFEISLDELYRRAYASTTETDDPETQLQWEGLPGWKKRLALLLLDVNLRVQAEVDKTQAQVDQLEQPAPESPHANGRRRDGGAIGYRHSEEVAADTEEIA